VAFSDAFQLSRVQQLQLSKVQQLQLARVQQLQLAWVLVCRKVARLAMMVAIMVMTCGCLRLGPRLMPWF
jgi:hypothetical protein